MKKLLVTLGFVFFIVEILIGGIYALTLIPWEQLGSLFTSRVIVITVGILWNVVAALFLYLGYDNN